MKLVEAFLFSEEYEKELLYLKLVLGNDCIDEWIVCENAYSHQGDFKGHLAKNIIENDERFHPYRNRITVIEGNRQFAVIDKSKKQDSLAFVCENWQRGQAYDHFMNKYDKEDWLILHDVDETIDFTDSKRKAEFFAKLDNAKSKGFLNVPRQRYWYDFDNEYQILYGSPLCTKAFIQRNSGKTLSKLRDEIAATSLDGWENIVAFEYSSCFSASHIMRKLETTAHTGYNINDLKQSLRCNHRIVNDYLMKQKLRPTKKFFFETVELNEKNSPAFVRERLHLLKTNNIDSNYRENRREDYPQFYATLPMFSIKFSDALKSTKKKLKKKSRFLARRLKIEKFLPA